MRRAEGETDVRGRRELPGEPGGPVLREWSSLPRRWPAEAEAEVGLGEIAIYVARGALEVDLDGDLHALAEGDVLRFDGSIPHRVRRTGGTTTRALLIAQGR